MYVPCTEKWKNSQGLNFVNFVFQKIYAKIVYSKMILIKKKIFFLQDVNNCIILISQIVLFCRSIEGSSS